MAFLLPYGHVIETHERHGVAVHSNFALDIMPGCLELMSCFCVRIIIPDAVPAHGARVVVMQPL